MNLQYHDILCKRIPRSGYSHVCIGFHEDAADRNEYLLCRFSLRDGWLLDFGGVLVPLTEKGFTLIRWAELPKLQEYDTTYAR